MIKFIPVMVFEPLEFRDLILGDLHWAVGFLEGLRIQAKKQSGYQWDSSNFRLKNLYGDEFTFQLSEGKNGFSVHIWDYKGQTALFSHSLSLDMKLRQNVFMELANVVAGWSSGQVRCSDESCHKWMNYQENKSNRYFAGVYCKDCWEKKWKEIEAAETYN